MTAEVTRYGHRIIEESFGAGETGEPISPLHHRPDLIRGADVGNRRVTVDPGGSDRGVEAAQHRPGVTKERAVRLTSWAA